METRNFTVNFQQVKGKKGDKIIVTERPEIFFRGQVLISLDPKVAKVTSLLVGARVQFGLADVPPTFSKEGSHERYEIATDVCWPGQTVALGVEFIADGKWSGTLIGKGISPQDLFPQVEKAFK